ncbi:hypothetical protein NQ314_001242 [Rhamnusium bicolor]|uniref:Uncharacterized protein n=1 Tax=Rhamnusium bicolor TaxID=1586634 RepID=A0AAV8ZSQ7_9CUCU|nr:hypothetical protein NQ314_001242 [Rhamnusium bicolor]
MSNLYVLEAKVTSDDAYMLLDVIPSDGASVADDDEDWDDDVDLTNNIEIDDPVEDENMESDGNNNEDNTGNHCDNNVNTCDDDGITSDSLEYDIPLSLVMWNKKDFTPNLKQFKQIVGPNNVQGKSTPYEYFQCFANGNLLNGIVFQTDLY